MKCAIIVLLILMPFILAAQNFQPGDHELFLMPTAYTMPKGNSYFSNYELVFLNYTFAQTPTTHIGAFTLFPITKDFVETFTFGAKQNYLKFNKFQGALWATYTPKIKGITIGNVFSIGKKSNSLHIGIGAATADEASQWELLYLIGYRKDVSKKVSLIAEYTNSQTLLEEENFNGLISIGARFRGGSVSWELAGVRPLESTGDFLFFPLLKATIHID